MNFSLHSAVLASMTVSEFRAFKRALRVLLASGLTFDAATDVLVHARQNRYQGDGLSRRAS